MCDEPIRAASVNILLPKRIERKTVTHTTITTAANLLPSFAARTLAQCLRPIYAKGTVSTETRLIKAIFKTALEDR